MRTLTTLTLLICLAALSTTASANSAAVFRRSAVAGAPHTFETARLAVDREKLIITCEGSHGAPVCRFVARYEVRNPSGRAEAVSAAFVGVRTEDVAVLVDGRPMTATLTEHEQTVLKRALQSRVPRQLQPNVRNGHTRLDGFRFTIDGRRSTVVVASGLMRPIAVRPRQGWVVPAARSRHLLMPGNDGRKTVVHSLDYLLGPIRSWGHVGRVDVTIRYPEDWRGPQIRGYDERGRDVPIAWERGRHERMAELTTTFDGDALPAGIGMDFVSTTSPIYAGGPIIGFGGFADGPSGFTMRFGYEFAYPGWVLYGVALDTNFTDHVVIAPTVELASPFLLLLPSASVGIGPAFQVVPHSEVGVRINAGFSFGPVGVMNSIDIYPGVKTPDGKPVVHFLAMFQITL